MEDKSIEELNPPDNSVTQESDVSSGEGEGNDSEVTNLYKIVNQTLGSNYQSDEDALKGLKETKQHVGKLGKYRRFIEQLETTKGGENQALKFMEELTKAPEQKVETKVETTAQTTTQEQYVSKETYERDTFFAKQSFNENQAAILDALKRANPDKSWSEVAELPAFKSVMQVETGDKSEDSGSVLTSTQKIASKSADYAEDLQAALKTGQLAAFLAKHKGVDLTK